MEHRQENQTMDGKFIPMTSLTNGLVQQVAEGVFFLHHSNRQYCDGSDKQRFCLNRHRNA